MPVTLSPEKRGRGGECDSVDVKEKFYKKLLG